MAAMTVEDKSYQMLAAGHLRKQAKRLARELDGVCLAEDVECIHRARVASRRLRVVLATFGDCFGRGCLRRWKKEIRRVTSGLGEARDLDVQIDFLTRALGAVGSPERESSSPGIARLLVRTEQRRERLQPNVVETVERLRSRKTLKEMRATAKTVLSDCKSQNIEPKSPYVVARFERHLTDRLNAMAAYRSSLNDPTDQQQHHAMRIAAKRFRYTIELVRPVFGKRIVAHIDSIKWMQSLLGELHDCDVWLEQLDAFSQDERKRIAKRFGHAGPFAKLEPGIEYLREERRERRNHVFGLLGEYWQTLQQQRHWENLLRIIRGKPVDEPAPQDILDVAGHRTCPQTVCQTPN